MPLPLLAWLALAVAAGPLAVAGRAGSPHRLRSGHASPALTRVVPAFPSSGWQPAVLATESTASGLADEGVRLTGLGRLDEAQGTLERALSLARAAGDLTVEGRAEWGLGRIAFLRRDDPSTIEHYTRAEQLLDAAGAFELRAVLGLQRGRECMERGDQAGGERHYRAAAAIAGEHGPRWLHAQILRNLTFVSSIPIAERLVLIEDAERLIAGEGRPALEGLIAHQHGDLAFVAGDYALALRESERAVAILERTASRAELARALTSVGRIYRVHGEPELAIPWFRRALEVQRGLGDAPGAVQNLVGIAICETVLNRPDAATATYAEAVTVARTSTDGAMLSMALTQQAIGLVQLGRTAEATRALVDARALPDDPRSRASLWGAEGRVRFAEGRYADAVAAFDLALASPGLAADMRVQILDRRARALDALNRPDEAARAGREGIDALERLRATLVPRDYFKRGFDRTWAGLFSLTVRRLADLGRAEDALDVAERARARAFADLMASRLVERAAPLGQDAAGQPGRGLALDSTADVHSATVAEMRDTARVLRTTLVSYWVDVDRSFAWVVTPAGNVHLARLAIGHRDLQRAVAATAAAGAAGVAADTRARQAFRRLHDVLVTPLRAWLPERDGLVTIVPHGPLFRLSFAALTDRRGRYLVEDVSLAYAPSVAVLRLLHARAARVGEPSYLLVGDPRLPRLARAAGLVPLPGAVREVEAIRRRVTPVPATALMAAAASEAAVRRAAATASVVHLATHAIADDARPFESWVALAGGAGTSGADEDGRLTAEEVYAWRLDADLVVLSACRSAAGQVTGDGLLGLTRAFFAAGSRAVVATLWDLPDEAARVMLPRFHREWRLTGRKAEALRRAQLAYLADLRAGRVVVDSALGPVTLGEHPALWAGLVLQGPD